MSDSLRGGIFATLAAFEFYVGAKSDTEFLGPILFSSGGLFAYTAILCLIRETKS